MNQNQLAFLRMVRACEGTDDSPDGYRALYGYKPGNGRTFLSFADHPRQAFQTPWGWTSAAGAYQAMAAVPGKVTTDTWGDFIRARGPHDFWPASQDEFALWCIDRRGATADVEAGRLEAAIAKCAREWASLPGAPYGQPTRTMAFCMERYFGAGGRLAVPTPIDDLSGDVQPAAPIEDRNPPEPTFTVGGADNTNAMNQPQEGAQMGIAAIISLFGPVLADLIPQMTAIFKPKGEVAQRNTALAQTAIDTILKVTGQQNVQAAIEQMQADAAVKKDVTTALVTHPDIMPFIEVGGGVAAARDADLKVMAADKPFWKTSAVFWVSVMLVPMVLWYVGSSIVGGVDIPVDWPWYGQILLKLFGTGWSADARAGLANLVVGLVLGGICGVYFGVSVTQAKQAVPPSTNNTGA